MLKAPYTIFIDRIVKHFVARKLEQFAQCMFSIHVCRIAGNFVKVLIWQFGEFGINRQLHARLWQ